MTMGDFNPAMHLVVCFTARHVPQVLTNDGKGEAEQFVRQLSFFSVVTRKLAELTHAGSKLGLEVRLTAADGQANTTLQIAVWDHTAQSLGSDYHDLIEAMRRALPPDYGWHMLKSHDLNYFLCDNPQWWLAGAARRIEFVDIPKLRDFGPEGPAASQPQRKHPINRELADWDNVTDFIKPSSELRLCLPFIGPIQNDWEGQRRLLRDIHLATPASLSLSLLPLDMDWLANAREVVQLWQTLLAPYVDAMANVGSLPGGSPHLRNMYDRFWLPDAQLWNIQIRAAASEREVALALLQQFCVRFGGLNSFRLELGQKPRGLQHLARVSTTAPPFNGNRRSEEIDFSIIATEMNLRGVDKPDSEAIRQALQMLPHVYTLDEVTALLQLPVSDMRGLYGVQTRPLAPFSPHASQRRMPVIEGVTFATPRSDHEIRVGIVDEDLAQGADETRGPSRFKGADWHAISAIDLTKHALIVGSTGSGKTMTTSFLYREIDRLGIPIMVVEPVKTEYYNRLVPLHRAGLLKHKLIRVRFEAEKKRRAPDYFSFDPLRLPANVSVGRHLSYTRSCFDAAFPMEPVMSLVLESGLRDYYTAPGSDGGCGLTLFTEGHEQVARQGKLGPVNTVRWAGQPDGPSKGFRVRPSFSDFCEFFLGQYLDKQFGGSDAATDHARQLTAAFKDIFRRRFDNLKGGLLGEAFIAADEAFAEITRQAWEASRQPTDEETDPLAILLKDHAIVELDGIPDAEEKSLAMAFILTGIFERRQAEDRKKRSNPEDISAGKSKVPKHVLIVEEAHRVLGHGGSGRKGEIVGQDSHAKAVSLFVDMLAEIRALGQGLVIVEQIPSKIVPEAVKNTNLKIMLRVTAEDDRQYLGEAMAFTEEQRRYVTRLKASSETGIGMVMFEEGVDQPILLNLPLPREGEPGYGEPDWSFDWFFPSAADAGGK